MNNNAYILNIVIKLATCQIIGGDNSWADDDFIYNVVIHADNSFANQTCSKRNIELWCVEIILNSKSMPGYGASCALWVSRNSYKLSMEQEDFR